MKQGSGILAEYLAGIIAGPAWRDDGVLKLYLYCLSKASHNRFIWRGIWLQPGDMPLSKRQAADALEWSRNKLDRKLMQLSDCGLVSIRSIPQSGTLVHILDWHRDGATIEPTGYKMEPPKSQSEASSEARPSAGWPQNEASCAPVWIQNGASNIATGSTVKPNPYKENRDISPSAPPEPPGFTQVWLAYPMKRRSKRSEAAALITRALSEGATIQAILDALEADKRSVSWQQEDGRFIPGIVNWLQKEAWHSFPTRIEPKEDEEKWTSR